MFDDLLLAQRAWLWPNAHVVDDAPDAGDSASESPCKLLLVIRCDFSGQNDGASIDRCAEFPQTWMRADRQIGFDAEFEILFHVRLIHCGCSHGGLSMM